jgi:hypothetical protein
MKTRIIFVSATVMLMFGPASAKVEKEFPSLSIQPINSTAESAAPAPKEDSLPTTAIERTSPQREPCSTQNDGIESRDEGDRVMCAPAPAPTNGQADASTDHMNERSSIPQLRAFRQQSSQRFAP